MVLLSTNWKKYGTIYYMGRPKRQEATGVLAERQLPDGRRKIKLRQDERHDLEKQRLIEAAVALFLDTTQGRTWGDIAEELGVSPEKLRDLTKSEDFEIAYDRMFAEIGHDPRYKAVQGAMMDLLPKAVRELDNILSNRSGASAATKLKAIELVFEKTNLNIKASDEESDRAEIAKFLVEHRIKAEIPDEYKEAMKRYQASIVEGEFTEVEQIALPSSDIESSEA